MPKSATTDLWESISTHPHVIPGLLKEYHWWNRLIFGKRRTTCVHVIFSCNASIHIWTIYNIDSDSSISSYIDLFDAAADRINRTCAHNATHNNPCITGLPLLRWKLPNPDCLVLFFFRDRRRRDDVDDVGLAQLPWERDWARHSISCWCWRHGSGNPAQSSTKSQDHRHSPRPHPTVENNSRVFLS